MKNLSAFFILSVISIIFLRQNLFGQEVIPDNFENMTFQVELDKGSYLLSEPVFVKFKFLNQTGISQTSYSPAFIHESKLKVKSKDKSLLFESLSSINGVPAVRFPRVFQPNEFIIREELLNSAFVGAFFSEAGTYQLQFILSSSDGDKIIESNVIEIEIKNPQGVNKKAFNFLTKHKEYFGLSSWIFGEREGQGLLETFVNNYGETVYGELAIHSLGSIYFNRGEFNKAQIEFEKLKFSNHKIIADDATKFLKEIEICNIEKK